jgi:vancomycin resistance protein YoaR
VPSVYGQEIDADAAVSAVVSALESRGSGTPGRTVNFAVVPVAPEFGDSEATAIVKKVRRLGRWTTRFTVNEFNGGGQNIRRPARLINGTVVAPGEMFDFIDAAGPFTRRNGYTDGAAIIHGNTKPDGIVGGGLCSASTTLFNAVLRAGFQIDQRHNHAFYITRYPVGLDATIWENGRTRKSMRFTNDTAYPILIKGAYEHGAVTFSVYGVPDGRKVKFSKPTIKDEQEAKNYVIYTNDLPPGKFEQVEFRSPGFWSSVTRTVRDAAGNVIHKDTFTSDYRNVNGRYMVGRFPGDPRAGTRILASEYVRPGISDAN